MKEQEIRPRALFKGLLEAARDDAARLFSDRSGFLEIPCPACASALVGDRFTKAGFEYRLCRECGSLYQSPRPSAELFDSFYRESKFVEFFATEFYRQTEDARRTHLFRPRARLVAEWARRLNGTGSLADVGAGYGTFLEEVRTHGAFRRLIAVEPAARLAERVNGKLDRVLANIESFNRYPRARLPALSCHHTGVRCPVLRRAVAG